MSGSDLLRRAERVYEERWKDQLERTHLNFFIAIAPDSAEYFLGDTLSEASEKARAVCDPSRYCVLRVGHRTTVHIGACTS